MTDDIGANADSLERQMKARSGVNWVRLLNIVGPVLALLTVYGFFAIFVPSFRYAANIPNIARQTTPVAVAALGMTLVIICAGIDLSVGSLIALGSVVIAWLLEYGHMDPLVAAVGGIAVCALFGMLNGLIITRLRVVPFIVTLGMMLLVRGIAMLVAREQKIDTPYTWLTELMAMLPPERKWMWFPPGVWIAIVLAIIVAVMLRYTRLGRHIFAVGSNEMTARLCGVSVSLVKVIVFTLSGVFAGVASLMYFSRLTVGDPSGGKGFELDVIAAVVIGGGSLSGGEGSVLGTLVGALIMGVILAGCQQMLLPSYVQMIVTGLIIIAAVALDRLRHRRTS